MLFFKHPKLDDSTVDVLVSAQGAFSWQAFKSGEGAFTRRGGGFLVNPPPLPALIHHAI